MLKSEVNCIADVWQIVVTRGMRALVMCKDHCIAGSEQQWLAIRQVWFVQVAIAVPWEATFLINSITQ